MQQQLPKGKAGSGVFIDAPIQKFGFFPESVACEQKKFAPKTALQASCRLVCAGLLVQIRRLQFLAHAGHGAGAAAGEAQAQGLGFAGAQHLQLVQPRYAA